MTRRWRVTAVTALLASVGLVGLAGCGAAGAPVSDAAGSVAVEVASAMGADGQALAALGFDVEDIAAGAPSSDAPSTGATASPTASPGTGARGGERAGERAGALRERARARVLLRRNTLHGDVVVQGKDGAKTIAVQRGTVTAIDGSLMTVESTDGFAQTWTFGPDLRVVQRRATIQPSDVKVGTQLGVSGVRDGDGGVARLVVVPRPK